MKLNSLLEYLLTEKIRSKTFDIRELKKLEHVHEIAAYIHETLEPLSLSGGSSREVFILSSGKVLKLVKIVYSEDDGNYDEDTGEWVPVEDLEGSIARGTAQNEAEFNTYTEASPEVQKILPKLYDYDRNFYWLISELVKPLKWNDWTTFEKASGVSKEAFDDFRSDMNDGYDGYNEHPNKEDYEDNPFLLALFNLVWSHDISTSDLQSGDQWGTTTEGRLVLLDAGGTNEVLNNYYETE